MGGPDPTKKARSRGRAFPWLCPTYAVSVLERRRDKVSASSASREPLTCSAPTNGTWMYAAAIIPCPIKLHCRIPAAARTIDSSDSRIALLMDKLFVLGNNLKQDFLRLSALRHICDSRGTCLGAFAVHEGICLPVLNAFAPKTFSTVSRFSDARDRAGWNP